MKFKDKVANSLVLKEGQKRKSRKVKTKKGRTLGIIITFSTIAYLIFINIFKFYKVDKSTFFDSEITNDEILLYVAFATIILKIVFSSILAFLKKSIYSLNHYKLYNVIDILSNINLFVIFALNIYNYYSILVSYNVWVDSAPLLDNIMNLFKQDPKDLVLLAFTIVINLPVIFKFIIFSFTNGAILYLSLALVMFFPFFLFKYLFSNNRVFYEYEDLDEDRYIIRKRYLDYKGYGLSNFLKKLLVILIFFLIGYGYMFLMLLFTNNLGNSSLVLTSSILGAFLSGYFINVAYGLNMLQEHQLEKKEAEVQSARKIIK